MKKHVLLAGLMGVCCASQAQILVEGGNHFDLTFSNNIGSATVTVGDKTANNSMALKNGIALISGTTYVGREATATNNWLVLESASAMDVNGTLYVGDKGSDNVAWVQSGSYLEANDMKVGSDVSADGNIAYVDGGVLAVYGGLSVGDGGSENSLTVTNGGTVSANNFVVGVQSGSEDNWALVNGSALHAGDILAVGLGGSSNLLELANNAEVSAVTGYVGYAENADSNLLTVADSKFTVEGLVIGSISNSMNQVQVNDGGIVTLNELIIAGTNSFELNDGGTLVVNADFNAATNGFNWNAGGTLNIYGGLIGVTGLESNKTLGIYGTWNEAGNTIVVGGASSNNVLNIGGEAAVGTLEVGTGSNVVNNALNVSGAGAELIAGSIALGHTANSNNNVLVTSGGRVVLTDANGLTIEGGNTFTFENGGWLIASNTFTAPVDGLVFGEGGTFQAYGAVSGLTNVIDGNRTVLLTGGDWTVGADALVVGATNGGAIIEVTEGGALISTGAIVGESAGADGSTILLDDGDWDNTGTISVGVAGSTNKITLTNGSAILTDDLLVGDQGNHNTIYGTGPGVTVDVNSDATIGGSGSGNQILLEDGAMFTVGNDLTIVGFGNSVSLTNSSGLGVGNLLALSGGSKLEVDNDAAVTAGTFYQDGDSVLEFDDVTVANPVVAVTGTATFETNATIRYTGLAGDVGIGVTNTRKIVTSASLNVDTNALNAEAVNGLYFIDMITFGGNLSMQIVRQSLAESAGFETNSQMWNVATEIDTLATAGDQNANNQLTVAGQLSPGVDGQQNAQLTQLYERNVPTYMHMEGLFEGMRQVQNRGILPDDYWPVGVYGPHFPGNQAQLWFKGFGSWGSQSDDGSYSGYDQSVYGMVIGYDKAFKDLLVGLAGGYSASNIDQDDGDTSDSGIGYGILYGSYGSKEWFADLSLAYGMGSVENETGTAFDTSADIDASQFGFYLGGGKELIYNLDRIFVTPTLAISGGNWMQGSYNEKSSNSVVKKVEDYNRWSFKSELGVETVFRKELNNSILMPEVRAKWLHEFNTDEDSLGYTLDGGTGNYSFGMIAPVSDMLELGAGLSLWIENTQGTVYEYAIGYDARIGSGYMANVLNARVNIEF